TLTKRPNRGHNPPQFPSDLPIGNKGPYPRLQHRIPRLKKFLQRRFPMTNQPTRGAFNQGATPTITCINEATVDMGVDLNALITALQAYTNNNIVPVWSTPATLVQAASFQAGNWA